MTNATFAARLWAALGEDTMGRRMITCPECGRTGLHGGYGLCKACYGRRVREARPIGSGCDPATRLPIPAQTRCPGCPDVPACPRAVLPGTGYCLRCGQLQQVAA